MGIENSFYHFAWEPLDNPYNVEIIYFKDEKVWVISADEEKGGEISQWSLCQESVLNLIKLINKAKDKGYRVFEDDDFEYHITPISYEAAMTHKWKVVRRLAAEFLGMRPSNDK